MKTMEKPHQHLVRQKSLANTGKDYTHERHRLVMRTCLCSYVSDIRASPRYLVMDTPDNIHLYRITHAGHLYYIYAKNTTSNYSNI